ncbi:hypothetical protein HK098_006559 [Nowakowskiella sp. JEL0407]|nr:hypothetical protein HK098_006559 [Nowakowskiella sp. JEL0407]
MNSFYKLSRYALNNDMEEGCVDILVILLQKQPASTAKFSTRKPTGTAMLRTRQDLIQTDRAMADFNGINANLPHLERKNILEKICSFFDGQDLRFLILDSPRGSGKTFLLDLLESGKTKYKCYYLSCIQYQTLSDVLSTELRNQSGYFIELSSSRSYLPNDVDIIIMLDDAQVTYLDDAFHKSSDLISRA